MDDDSVSPPPPSPSSDTRQPPPRPPPPSVLVHRSLEASSPVSSAPPSPAMPATSMSLDWSDIDLRVELDRVHALLELLKAQDLPSVGKNKLKH